MVQKPLPKPKSALRRTGGHLIALLSTAILFPTLLLANAIQLLSLVTLPFSRRFFRSINRFCAASWWGLGTWWTEGLYGVKAVFYGDEIPYQENAIVVANHQQMPDIVALWTLAIRKGRLGDLKFMVKKALKFAPGVGWGMQFLDCPFLERNWESDKALIQRIFDKFSREKIPLWLISFVEGTRITPQKLQSANAFAARAGIAPMRNVLIPRTKGFVAAVEGLRSHIRAIYDVTIAYPEGIPTLWQLLGGYTREIHLYVRRFPIETVPEEPSALAAWLLERFRTKDELLGRFHENTQRALPSGYTPWDRVPSVSPVG